MKLIKVITRKYKEKKEVIALLKKKKITSYDIISDNTTQKKVYKFEILVTDQETGPLLGNLEKIGLGKSYANSIIILDVKASIPFKKKKEFAPRISEEEIEADIQSGGGLTWVYLGFISLSALIIALGLLGNNLIVLIGGMLIAPLLYPIIGSSYYLLKSNGRQLTKTLRSEIWGISLAIFWGIVLTGIVPDLSTNALILGRSVISFFDVGIAIFAGAAGALSVSTRNLGQFTGVAIAVALIPPAVTVGIGIGMANWLVVAGAAGLTLINLICVHLISMLIFSILGYGSTD